MDSPELYHVKQQFILGAYHSIIQLPIPDRDSKEYDRFLLYQARSLIALDSPENAEALTGGEEDFFSLKAAAALARYMSSLKSSSVEGKDAALEELRDLCVEIEGEELSERDKGYVRVLAGTAFVREGELEEALETLGAGSNTSNLEATAITVQIYLSINRPDLAKKEYERALKWAEDDLLLQFIEASIGLVTGSDSYANPYSFFTEQIGNPSVSSSHLLTSRAVTRLLKGDVVEAKSDLEEAMRIQTDAEALSTSVVAAGLGEGKRAEADELYSQLSSKYPTHPLVLRVTKQSEIFDEFASKFSVPPVATRA